MKSDTIVTFTDSNICTIAIGKAITFNIEMYQGDTKIMESNNNITLNVSTIIIKTGILYSKVDRHYAFNKTYMTCDSVNFTVYNKRILLQEIKKFLANLN
jgi:DNA-directed RNA polymerase alpha subunit